MSTAYPIIGDARKAALHKLYVCTAVALGVFVMSISTVGLLSHGFDFGQSPKDDGQSASATKAALDASLQQAAANQECRAAQLATQNALNAYQNTYIEMQDLIGAHFDQLTKDAKSGAGIAESGDPKVSPANVASGPPAIQSKPDEQQLVVNPQWKEMHDQLLQLEQRRAQLSANLQSTHPALERLDGSIADVQKQLKLIPAMIRQSNDSPTTAKVVEQPATEPKPQLADSRIVRQMETLARQWRQTDETYRKLLSRLTADKDACYMALDHESSAWQRKAELAVAHANKAVAGLPVNADRSRANLQMSILFCGLLALIAGIAAASAARVCESAFNTAAQVRQILGLPVLGAISWVGSQRPREQPFQEAIWVNRGVLAAELILAVSVVGLAIFSIADHRFFLDLLANPLKACSLKFWC